MKEREQRGKRILQLPSLAGRLTCRTGLVDSRNHDRAEFADVCFAGCWVLSVQEDQCLERTDEVRRAFSLRIR